MLDRMKVIKSAELSGRAIAALDRLQAWDLDVLAKLSLYDFVRMDNVGRKTINEIELWALKFNIRIPRHRILNCCPLCQRPFASD